MDDVKLIDGKKMAHDIANALLPALNYPDRVKIIERNLEYEFECLTHIHQALTGREKTTAEPLKDGDIGKKLAPALAELCRLGEKNLELYRIETEKLSRQLEKINGLVAEYRSSTAAGPINKNGKT